MNRLLCSILLSFMTSGCSSTIKGESAPNPNLGGDLNNGSAGASSGGSAGADSTGNAGAGSSDCGPCDGLCAGGVCSAFEVLAEGQYQTSYTRGIAFTDSAVYWASATDYSLATSFQVQKASKGAPDSRTALLTGLNSTNWVVSGSSSWIYFGRSGALERLSLDGATREVVYEKVVPDARIENGHIWRVEHWANATKVVLRAENATSDTTMLEFVGDNWEGQKVGALEASADGVLAAVNFTTPEQYDILSISADGGTQPLVSHMAGKVTRLRLSDGDVFWIEQPTSGSSVLRRSNNGEVVSITSAETLHDFAIDGQHLYVAFTLDASEAARKGYQRGIRMIKLEASEEVDVATGFQPGSLEVSDGYLYLFDRSAYRLVRAATP
jgi:hypothetical protein